MMKILIFSLLFPFLSFAQNSSEVNEQLKNYFVYKNGSHLVPKNSNGEKPKPTIRNEREFIDSLKMQERLKGGSGLKLKGRATGSGNGGDPVAFEFSNLATNVLSACHVQERVEKVAPRAWINTSNLKVAAVNFNLCEDDSSSCTLDESAIVKALPSENLILVNIPKWQPLSGDDKTTEALHASLMVMGLTAVELELPNQIRLQVVQSGTYPRFVMTTHCLELK